MSHLHPITQIEETIYIPGDAKSGAGPHWCFGGSTIVRRGDRLFCCGIETLPGEIPLHNSRWFLATRLDSEHGWQRIYTDFYNRTREPSPIAITDRGLLYTSANPTLAGPQTYSGPALPTFHAFDVSQWPPLNRSRHNLIEPIATELPAWDEAATFTEHSYRTLAADPVSGNVVLFNNIGYNHAHWAFHQIAENSDGTPAGKWTASGKIVWPRHITPQGKDVPLRVCYSAAILAGKAVHFFGISDIEEFDPALAALKFKLTGNKWDYVFCRMFYTYTPDITTTPFSEWVEVANVEPTRGWTLTGDLHVDSDGAVHMLWYENSITPQLRDAAFPGVPVTHKIQYARMRGGVIEKRISVLDFEQGQRVGFLPHRARFHHTPTGRRFVVANGAFQPRGPGLPRRNAMVMREMLPNDELGPVEEINLTRPFANLFFTTTRRSGSTASPYLDLLGGDQECGYARVLIAE